MKPCSSGVAGSTAGAGGKLRDNGRSQSGGFMDLVFEKLPYLDGFNGQACTAFSIAHYFKQNGDLFQDPEMVVLVYPELQMAEAFAPEG
jgi:hypothetical protein